MNIPTITEYKGKLHLQKHYPEFYNYILKKYSIYNYSKFNELIYCYFNNIISHPTCPVCGKEVPFLSIGRGYQTYCSAKCAGKSKDTLSKRIATNIDRFGTEYAIQNPNIKDKTFSVMKYKYNGIGNGSNIIKEKQEQTMLNRYGVKYALQNNILKAKSLHTHNENNGGIGMSSSTIRQKIEASNIDRYGHPSSFSSPEIRNKILKTNKDKYGYIYPSQSGLIKNKIKMTKNINFIRRYNNIISTYEKDDLYYKVSCPHPKCNKCNEKYYDIPANIYWNRRYDDTEPCSRLLPVSKSHNKNTSLELFIINILNQYNIDYIQNDRSILGSKEIDIYIPSKNIAIECNGCYWHSTKIKPPQYHINKFKECRGKNIQLISIWQDWIIHKPEIVKSLILSKLGIYGKRVYARKCDVKKIDSLTANNFLNNNHIQGAGKSLVRYGLYYKEKLLSVMTFSKNMACSGSKNETGWNLNRFCAETGVQIVGGAERLLVHFIKEYHPEKIISFSSNDISTGDLYKKLSFHQEGGINKSYWYIEKNTLKRYHRSRFTLKAIQELGWKIDGSEKQTMYNHGYLQCYDSGQMKWIWNKKSLED